MDHLPAVICGVLWLAAALLIFAFRKSVTVTPTPPETEPQPTTGNPPQPLSAGVYLLLLALAAVSIYTWPDAFGNRILWMTVLALPPAAFLLLIAFLSFRIHRQNRHTRMVRQGDADGALIALRDEIEQKGPTAERLNNLGTTLTSSNRWREALEAFEEAVAMDAAQPVYRANQALALWKVGRADEAVPLFEQAREEMPDIMIVATNFCQLLAELDRWDEACDQLQAAEKMFPKSRFSSKERELVQSELETCRELCRATRSEIVEWE